MHLSFVLGVVWVQGIENGKLEMFEGRVPTEKATTYGKSITYETTDISTVETLISEDSSNSASS